MRSAPPARPARSAIAGLALFLAAGSLGAQSPALDAAAAAMGGRDRLLAVRTLVLEGTGWNLNYGQNHTPNADTRFEVTAFRWSTDFPNRRHLIDLTREPRFTTGNTTPQRQRFGVDGAVGYGILANGTMTRTPAQATADRAHNLAFLPIGFVQAAYAPGTELSEEPAAGGMRRVRINVGGEKYAMIVDPRTSLPVNVEKVVYQPMLGDVSLFLDFAEWQDGGGIQHPMRLTQRYENVFTIGEYRLAAARVDVDVGDLAATDSVRSVVQASGPAAPNVTVDTVAPGVWRIAGQSHHTIAIEQSNRVVLVEAPQNDARTLAAIAKARELAPAGKPVDLIVNTHHHFDHSGGFRAAVSEGLQVATHRTNKDFYERVVFPRRHFIVQDALARNPKPLRLMTIADRHTLRDDLRTVEIHHVAGNAHNGGMLVVYLPAERILIQADLYVPPPANAPPGAPAPVYPFLANLVENVTRKGLLVDRVVGIHGLPAPWSQVQAAASASRAP
jgi:glyoxylase-like metal-dependent hydrolase (beta-lactamase superfamily II)